METSAPGIFAAGDIARYLDLRWGDPIRVEHWVVAQRQGEAAARSLLDFRERYADVPYFWSQHYETPINYVGHAESWDEIAVEGDVGAGDCLLRFKRARRTLVAASIFRDIQNLEVGVSMELETAG